MNLRDYKIILYRQDNGDFVAEVPCLPACYALSDSREMALAELRNVFAMVADEYRESGRILPPDSTEVFK